MKGILLINLGSPKDLELDSVKEYLKEFLSDDLVIDSPKFLQQILVNWIIVPSRYKNTREAYSEIWTDKGSPLINSTIELGAKINSKSNIPVEVAMRYQYPSIETGILNLKEKGCSEIFVVPLYPHYAMSTTLTTQNEVLRVAKALDLNIDVTFIDSFFNEQAYISSLSQTISDNRSEDSDFLLFSYHGIPNRHLLKTDPTKNHCLIVENCCDIVSEARPYCYKAQVYETSKLCANYLNLESSEWSVSFQSRIGPGWIEPFTDKELELLVKKGVKKLDVACPSFVIDNLETLEEMNIRGRETFIDAGGESFNYIPCINTNEQWVDFLISSSKK